VLPQLANQLGWIVAELGRQPWIVYGVLRTRDGVSPRLDGGEVAVSIVLFGLVYGLLLLLFLFLLDQKIRHGPDEEEAHPLGHRADA
jgi:cytochrome d ubiquinol oxidase subunit I